MSVRMNPRDRCPHCKMKNFLCLCSLRPQFTPRTQIEILIHPKEVVRTSNTGNLAHICLTGSQLKVCDRRTQIPWQSSGQGARTFLFYPTEDAQWIDQSLLDSVNPSAPIHLLVLDGSWKQAGRMLRHIDAFKKLPKLRLPNCDSGENSPSEYRLRRPSDLTGRLSTLESIAKALALLEGPEEGPKMEQALLRIQRIMVARTLLARGKMSLAQAQQECEMPTVKIHELIHDFKVLNS